MRGSFQSMKITGIETRVVNADRRNWVFVKVVTDQPGLYGWGEGTLEWKTRSVVAAVEDMKPLLLGLDPRNIEQSLHRMLKFSFWPQGPIGMTAISAVEQALWDIFGKSVGLPVWRLLGGQMRDRVRLYTHLGFGSARAVYGRIEPEPLVERALELVAQGYTAMKVLLVPFSHYTATIPAINHVGELMAKLRSAVGDEVDIMIDFHGRPASVSLAVQYIRALAPYGPLFVEEPVQPGDAQALRDISTKVDTPVATGERLIGAREFEPLFAQRAVSIVQPDLSHCGGLLIGRRIAAAAELAFMGVAPHNPAGPIASAVALHFAVATANFVIQEEMAGAVPWFDEVVQSCIVRRDGCWQVPQEPGLGVDVDEREAGRHPYVPEDWAAAQALMPDGTVVDR
jgi:galactonate dehydratase